MRQVKSTFDTCVLCFCEKVWQFCLLSIHRSCLLVQKLGCGGWRGEAGGEATFYPEAWLPPISPYLSSFLFIFMNIISTYSTQYALFHFQLNWYDTFTSFNFFLFRNPWSLFWGFKITINLDWLTNMKYLKKYTTYVKLFYCGEINSKVSIK